MRTLEQVVQTIIPLLSVPRREPPMSADEILDAFLEYTAARSLDLYPAQEQAILDLLDGCNVILKTPTGSGKSLVAAALHFSGLCQGKKSVYTSPIKALVNEKFLSLCREFGPAQVGMSTGDASVNLDAPILCCTAEVLANLALRLGDALPVDDVIMDEFHYYSDRERGVSWQVPLLTLPQARFLLLSATLGETRFFEEELSRGNGRPTRTITSSDRPVPLTFSYLEENLEEIVKRLAENDRLPAYLVHFTQRGATETAQKLMSLDVTTKSEKKKLGERLAGERFNSPFGRDLRKHLRHGIGVHHAGLLPKYRILVEKLAQENLLKLICGTDTLGVGVNIPIRTVVFTALAKYDGEKQKILPVRDFHQISGRAGRKGFDERGDVLVMAPEHIIENRKLEKKSRENAGKQKKFTRRSPPKGSVQWDEKSFERLLHSPAETLVGSFTVSHGMLLNVLSRQGDGCRAMREILRNCHETAVTKQKLVRRSFQLFRALLEKGILEFLPEADPDGRKLRLREGLQSDFSLHQALSLYLVDTVQQLDKASTGYSLRVLSLVEAILENPEPILRRQVERLKTEKLNEFKEQGLGYEERMAKLAEIEHPKPEREFIYGTFNSFAASHPWVDDHNIQPKSIAREMYESYQGFGDYVRSHGLDRVEGLLLRHLSSVYKTLRQGVPENCRNDELEDILVYLEEVVRSTDASLLEEWELLRHPEAVLDRLRRPEPSSPAAGLQLPDPRLDRPGFERRLRHAIFMFLEPVARQNYAAGAHALAGLEGREGEEDQQDQADGAFTRPETAPPLKKVWTPEALRDAFAVYHSERGPPRLDPAARARENTIFDEQEGTVEQILIDRDSQNDWRLLFVFDRDSTQQAGAIRMHLEMIGPIQP